MLSDLNFDLIGRKIPDHLENPLDNLLIKGCEYSAPFLKKLKMTPNILTTIGLIFGLLSIICLIKDKFILGFIFYWISYWFDCVDGYFARKYKMETKFGDYYDHVRDVGIFGGVTIVLLIKLKSTPLRVAYGIAITFSFILMLIHMGCQENHSSFETHNDCLGKFKGWCPNHEESIKISRFFGCGTLHLVQSIFILLCAFRYSNKSVS